MLKVVKVQKKGLNTMTEQTTNVTSGGMELTPLNIRHAETETLLVEFLVKDSDLIFHFWVQPGYIWHPDFRGILFRVMTEQFRLEKRPDQLLLEWIPELSSWCVTVKGVAVVVPPDDEIIINAIALVGESSAEPT
jgi:hypothetical protein